MGGSKAFAANAEQVDMEADRTEAMDLQTSCSSRKASVESALRIQLSLSEDRLTDEKEKFASLEKSFIEKENELENYMQDKFVEMPILRTQLLDEQRKTAMLGQQLAKNSEDLQYETGKTKHSNLKLQKSEDKARLMASQVDTERSKSEKLGAQLDKFNEIAKASVAVWYWCDPEDQWHAFDMAATPQLECAYRTDGPQGTCQVQCGMHFYVINFGAMTQTNTKTGKTRNVRRDVLGSYNSDPLNVVQHVLAQRSSEAEAVKAQLARAEADLETQGENMVKLQQYNRQSEQALKEERWSLAVLNSNVQKMQDKHNIDMKQAKEEGCNACRAEVQQMQVAFDDAKRKNQDECNRYKAAVQKMQGERDDAKRKNLHATDVNIVGTAVRSYTEFWKASRPLETRKLEESPSVMERVMRLFTGLSHQNAFFNGKSSRCHAFQQMKVVSVHSLHNPQRWSKYTTCKEELRQKHHKAGINVKPLPIHALDDLIEGVELDKSLNEVLLAHGCSPTAAAGILEEGFDMRYTTTNGGDLYGQGLYLADELCKSHQYTNCCMYVPRCTCPPSRLRHIIIARVAMGDPCFLKTEYQGRLPQFRDPKDTAKGRYDSHAVDPASSVRGQAHREYVIFDGAQAYAEMLVTYEVP